MRGLIFHGPGDVQVEEVPHPEPGPGDVLVRVEVELTDGTDLKAFWRGHPLLLGEPPSPFGHEFCGIDVKSGRRVVAANSAPCGECAPCRRGQETLCERLLSATNVPIMYCPGALLPMATGSEVLAPPVKVEVPDWPLRPSFNQN